MIDLPSEGALAAALTAVSAIFGWLRAIRINATATTCTGMVAFYGDETISSNRWPA